MNTDQAFHSPITAHQNQRPTAQTAQTDLARLEKIADVLDKKFLDPILGLVFPGVGDALGSAIGLYTVFVAWRVGLHPLTLARMLTNLGIDAIIGSIPILGWIGDFFYRPHVRNLNLLKRRLGVDEGQSMSRNAHLEMGPDGQVVRSQPSTSDYAALIAASVFLAAALLLPVVLMGLLIAWMITLL